MIENKLAEHDKDIEETKKLLSLATRIAQQAVLNEHLAKLTALRSIAESKIKEHSKELNQPAPKLSGFTKVIETYGWDQSDKFIKVYITSLNDISKVDPNNVTCDFTDKSFDLIIRNLNSINYTLSIVSLFKNINPKESSFKVKSDMIVLMLRKTTSESWGFLTEKEANLKKKDDFKPDLNTDADPQDGLMKLMKKMYDDGDDEMKRTISKAFVESREKQANSEPII